MNGVTVDVVIPVYHPGTEFEELLFRLELQKQKIRYIYLMHTKDGIDLKQMKCVKDKPNIILQEVEPEEFDHGGTRDQGIRMSDADYVICMTQDAVPADTELTGTLIKAFEDEQVAVSYARQLPKKDCNIIERYTRRFNYPESSVVKSEADLDTMGIKTYFCSNVCAAYRKRTYEELNGFETRTIFNEDMLFAAKAVQNGYKIAYLAEARVYHSHNYTNLQQFRRNFDLAVSQADHPEIFEHVRSESEGIRMVKDTAKYLLRIRHPFLIFSLILGSAAKYSGYFLGKRYRWFPDRIVEICTMNPGYWGKS